MGLRERLAGAGDDQQPIEPTGRTIDAEVEPVKLNLDISPDMGEPSNALGEAIAAHFGIEPENITGFVVAVEHSGEQGMGLASAWSLISPVWRLKAMARELLAHLESQ
jgi:hypothetical protein